MSDIHEIEILLVEDNQRQSEDMNRRKHYKSWHL